MEEQVKFLDGISEEVLSVIQKYFPNFSIPGWGYAGPNFHFDLPDHFKSFENTPYYYWKEMRFIHWTTVDTLASIINNREVRLYNLINSEDEEEFIFSAKLLELSAEQIENIKTNYFTLSCCEKSNLQNEFLWKKYGRDQSGVAIEFSIINDRNDWENFMISEVYYRLPESFEPFQKELNAIKEKYNSQIDVAFNIWKLAGFHKKTHFASEKEVRLSTCFPYNSEDYLKYAKKEFRIDGIRNRIVNYIPLKLWIDFESAYPKEFYKKEDFQKRYLENLKNKPHIKIENIYLGKNSKITNKEYYNTFRNSIREMISFQLGYSVDLPLNLFEISKT